MSLRALFHRLAVTAVASGLALSGLALSGLALSGLALPGLTLTGPAQAADDLDFAYVGILGPETVTVVNGQSKTVKLDLVNLGAAAENVVLTFGSTAEPISADLGFTAPDGCRANSCRIGDLRAGERRGIRFTVKPAVSGAADPVGSIALTTTIGGRASDETSIAVVRTDKGGVDIEVDDIADLKLSPGGSADVPVAVRNTGNKDVKALGLLVLSPHGVTAALPYRNCESDAVIGGFVCVFNETLAAGGSFTLPEATPLRVTVPNGTGGPYDYPIFVAVVGLTDRFVVDFAKRTAGATGRELELESLASISAAEPDVVPDLNENDNIVTFAVSVPKTIADSAAVGGVFSGAVGDERTVKVGVRNLGPSATVPADVDWLPYAQIKLPTGVRLTRLDERCLPGRSLTDLDEEFADLSEDIDLSGVSDLVCLVVDAVPSNSRYLFDLSAEILDTAEHRAGHVKVDGGVQDPRSGNDKATLAVELTAGGGGGGLPITGAPVGPTAAVGAALLVAGLIAYRSARRRRIVTVAE